MVAHAVLLILRRAEARDRGRKLAADCADACAKRVRQLIVDFLLPCVAAVAAVVPSFHVSPSAAGSALCNSGTRFCDALKPRDRRRHSAAAVRSTALRSPRTTSSGQGSSLARRPARSATLSLRLRSTARGPSGFAGVEREIVSRSPLAGAAATEPPARRVSQMPCSVVCGHHRGIWQTMLTRGYCAPTLLGHPPISRISPDPNLLWQVMFDSVIKEIRDRVDLARSILSAPRQEERHRDRCHVIYERGYENVFSSVCHDFKE
eukprot:8669192-Pyramimonas_sp.AAC.2